MGRKKGEPVAEQKKDEPVAEQKKDEPAPKKKKKRKKKGQPVPPRKRMFLGGKEVPQLEAFMALAEMGDQFEREQEVDYRHVERAMGKGHDQMGRYLDQLEKFFEVKLIERANKPFRLTTEGVQLAVLAKMFRADVRAFAVWRTFRRPTLRLGAFNAIFRAVLPSTLKPLKGDFDIDLVEGQTRQEIIGFLHSGTVDVAFDWVRKGQVHPAEQDNRLTVLRIGEYCPMVAVADGSTHGDFALRKYESLADASRFVQCLILDSEEAEMFAGKGLLPQDRKRITCRTIATILSLVRQGFGIGIVWDIGDLLEGHGLVKAEFTEGFLSSAGIQPIKRIAFWRKDHLHSFGNNASEPLVQLVNLLQSQSTTG